MSKPEPAIYRTYEDFPAEDLFLYAGVDCLATSTLLSRVFPRVVERKPYVYSERGQATKKVAPAIIDFMEGLEMPAHEFIIDMEINGIKYDVDLNKKQAAQIEEELPDLEEKVFSLFGRKFNPDSGKEMSNILYGELGFTPPSFTKSNEPSTDGDALIKLATEHDLEWLKVLARRNNLASVHRTFFKNYVEDFVKRDGRVHPSYNLFGTSSFRITGDTPNLTQLPNEVTEKRLGYSIRNCFTVDPGDFFLCADYSSAEVKVLGALCKDPKLLRAIQEGKDFHSYSASSMYGIPYDEFVHVLEYKGVEPELLGRRGQYKAMRQGAKALTFGILYGSSVRGIAYNLGITEQEASRLIGLYFKEFPLIEVYVKDSHNMAKWNHYVMNAFGQAKRQFGAMNLFSRTAVHNAALRNSQNVRVQSTASSMGLRAFSWVNEDIKPLQGKSLCTVYDSLEVSGPIGRGAEIVERVFYNMDDRPVKEFDWLDLPIGTDVEIGFTWGHMEKVKRGITQVEFEQTLARLAA